MKVHNVHHRNQKPIKYKEFIQQLQNSSNSSIQDLSMLSHRSFRQSNTMREGRNDKEKQKQKRNDHDNQKNKNDNKNLQQLNQSYKISRPSNQNIKDSLSDNKNLLNKQDKLYTFCDTKLTQRSIEFMSNTKTQNQLSSQPFSHQTTINNQTKQQRYFRTMKNQQKENINFVNNVLQKVQCQSSKIKKQQSSAINKQNCLRTMRQKSPQPLIQTKNQQQQFSLSLSKSQPNSQRKIESVKKVNPSVSTMRQSSGGKRNSQGRLNVSGVMMVQSKVKSSQMNLNSRDSKLEQQSSQKQSNLSSKKKIISLNINPLKAVNQTRIKLKLSMERSNQKQQKFFQQPITISKHQQQNDPMIQPKAQLYNSSEDNQSSNKPMMQSLQQSKIQDVMENENSQASRSNLLMSGASMSSIVNLLSIKENCCSHPSQQQLLILQRTIFQQTEKQKQKPLSKPVYQINQKPKHHVPQINQQKQLQILQKDCQRLTISYKDIKKLYQLSTEQNQHLIQQLQQTINQNTDLKECLAHKTSKVQQLSQKLSFYQQRIIQLQQQLQNTTSYPQQLTDLSHMIKQKLQQYQSTISSLLEQNQNLQKIKEKLQNYSQTLKEELEEKDYLLIEYEKQLRECQGRMKHSAKVDVDERRREKCYMGRVRELESKLKLANVHIDYLTRQIVEIRQQEQKQKQQKQQKHQQYCNEDFNTINKLNNQLSNNLAKKQNYLSTMTHTITTRNSSISHNNGQLEQSYKRNMNGNSFTE